MRTVTLDTGALIALERRRQRIWQVFDRFPERGVRAVVPADVVAEWWRGPTDFRETILDRVIVEPLTSTLARLAGEAMAAIRMSTVVDAIVMASAAQRGDVVLTSDLQDLGRLQQFFPSVRLFGIG